MSFGKSYMVRFATTKHQGGGAQILWEQENIKKPKKKVNYKSREQQYPLRSRVQQEAAAEEERQAPLPKPKKIPVKQRKPPGWDKNPPKSEKENDTKTDGAVTLTQDELTTILSSLGKVTKDHPLRISIDKETNRITIEESSKEAVEKGKKKKKKKHKDGNDDVEELEMSEKKVKKKKEEKKENVKTSEDKENLKKNKRKNKKAEDESIFNLIGQRSEASEGEDADDEGEELVSETEEGSQEEEEVEESEEEEKEEEEEKVKKKRVKRKKANKNEDEDEKDVDMATPRSTIKGDDQKTPTNPLLKVQYLSISEKKRLQWEKERAEQRADYNPWGKPGAGAPIKDSAGDVLADYNTRKEQDFEDKHSPGKQQVVEEQMNLVSPRNAAAKPAPKSPPGNTTLTLSSYVDQSKLPAAMRSSFAVGGTVADGNRYMNTKDSEKKKWLEDLERQIEEKKQQKLGQKPGDKLDDTWADKLSSHKMLSEHEPSRIEHDQSTIRASTAPDEKNDDLQFQPQMSTFLRGQNAIIDPATMQELAEKRQRHMEHQRAIQAQVEEHQRLKRLERERKLQEDMEEERKLQVERDRLQHQFEMEQVKQKRKEYEQGMRVQMLKEAMDEAHQKAMQDKHLKRIQHLKEHGHDVSQLHKSFEAKYTPRAPVSTYEPPDIPGLDLMPEDEAIQQTTRVLTPSRFRHADSEPDLLSPRKDSGVQTDPIDGAEAVDTIHNRDTSAGIEFKGPVGKKWNRTTKGGKEKKVRLRSANAAPEMKEKEQPQKPRRPRQKPLWNQPPVQRVRPLKQTEKDPNYQRRKRQADERRMRREHKLLSMQEANMQHIPVGERGKSRSPSLGRTVELGGHRREPSPEPELRVADITPRSQRRSRLDQHNSRREKSRSPEMNSFHKRVSRSPPKHRNNDINTPAAPSQSRQRSKSPPVPAVRHRLQGGEGSKENTSKHFDTLGDHRGHYSDLRPAHAPVDNGDFVPFMRSSAFLDPADSQKPLPVSREVTRVEQGRKAYAQGLKPGDFGSKMEHIQDTGLDDVLPGKKTLKDPIMNPSLVKDHPTQRQDIILQQLSSIRKNLLQRQREIETCLQPGEVNTATYRTGME